MTPETHYAKSGDIRIAYQINGQGPDMVFAPGTTSHLDLDWEFTSFFQAALYSSAPWQRFSTSSRIVRLEFVPRAITGRRTVHSKSTAASSIPITGSLGR